MKTLKYILWALLGLVVLALIIAAILPKTFHAGSEIVINKPAQEVFDYVKQIKLQGEYDNWTRQDPDIQKEYIGEDGTVGFTYIWKSTKVGNGKQTITKIDEGRRIDLDLFFNDSEDANKSYIQVEAITPAQSKVHWTIDGQFPYPFNIMGLFVDMNKDFDQGLINLKKLLEQ